MSDKMARNWRKVFKGLQFPRKLCPEEIIKVQTLRVFMILPYFVAECDNQLQVLWCQLPEQLHCIYNIYTTRRNVILILSCRVGDQTGLASVQSIISHYTSSYILTCLCKHFIMRKSENGFINTCLINSALRLCKVKTTPYAKTTSVLTSGHTSSVCPSVCDLVATLNHFSYFYEFRCGSFFTKKKLSSKRKFRENRVLVVIIYFRA